MAPPQQTIFGHGNRPPQGRPITGLNAPNPTRFKELLKLDFKNPKAVTIKVTMFWTKSAGTPSHIPNYRTTAKSALGAHNLTLDILEPEKKILDYNGAARTDEEINEIRGLAEIAFPTSKGAGRLPVIVCPFVQIFPNQGVSTFGDFGMTKVSQTGGSVVIDGVTWLPFVMINSLANSADNITLVHEIGHAAGLKHLPANLLLEVQPGAMEFLTAQKIDVTKNFMNDGKDRQEQLFAYQIQKLAGAYFAA